MAWMFAEWVKYGKPSVLGIVTGMVAGLSVLLPPHQALLAPVRQW